MEFKDRSVISINDFSKEDLLLVLDVAAELERRPQPHLLQGKVMATLFYEPSTRTRLSFESAMQRLGGSVLGFADAKVSSASKGETVADAARMAAAYADVVVQRHPVDGSARVAAEAITKPLINAGDGVNQHPTQTLLDLYSIQKTQGTLYGLKVAFVGDLKYGRTVHSLAIALAHFNTEFFFIAPAQLQMPDHIVQQLRQQGRSVTIGEDIAVIVPWADIIYMTRIQKERFPEENEYNKFKNAFVLKKDDLTGAKKSMRILHPLPRVNEIAHDVDATQHAYYFQQAANGVPVRQALLALVLGGV